MEKFNKGNEKKKQTVKKLQTEIISKGNSFAIFKQEDGIDCYSIDQIRSNARLKGLKLISIPNKILLIALEQQGFRNESMRNIMKNNNFIVVSEDAIKSTTLSDCIKDKHLKNRILLQGLFIRGTFLDQKDQLTMLVKTGSETGLKIRMIQTLNKPTFRFVKMLDLHNKNSI